MTANIHCDPGWTRIEARHKLLEGIVKNSEDVWEK